MTIRALIAEDEAHVAADLRARLAAGWPELAIVEIARNGIEAVERIEAEKPDIAFLDINMPGMTGLEVVQQLTHPCLLVFVTAYDRFAVDAFDRAAVDYLIKPVSDERLAKTIDRLKQVIQKNATPDLNALMTSLQAIVGAHAPERLKWIKASLGDKVRLVAVEDIFYFQSADKYTSLFTRDSQLLIRTPIKDIIERLDPDQFWQIHRGIIVNLRQILAVTNNDGEFTLKLRDRPESLPISRSYTHLFKQM